MTVYYSWWGFNNYFNLHVYSVGSTSYDVSSTLYDGGSTFYDDGSILYDVVSTL